MLDHLSMQCRDVAPLGGVRAMDFGEVTGFGVGDNREVHIASGAE